MEPIRKIGELKKRLVRPLKIAFGTFVVSGVLVGGATLLDDAGFDTPWDTKDMDQEGEKTDSASASTTNSSFEGSSADNAEEERVNALSNDTEAERHHRYGC